MPRFFIGDTVHELGMFYETAIDLDHVVSAFWGGPGDTVMVSLTKGGFEIHEDDAVRFFQLLRQDEVTPSTPRSGKART